MYVTLSIYNYFLVCVNTHILAIVNIRNTKFGINVLVYLAQIINNRKFEIDSVIYFEQEYIVYT